MLTRLAVVVCLLGSVSVAEPFVISFHEASGNGTANVFDGGPPIFLEEQTEDPLDRRMSFTAADCTRPGSLGACAFASVDSRMTVPVEEDRLRLRVDLRAAYLPSLFGGGDNPGGMAEAEVSSTIEFVMPVNELEWAYSLNIDDFSPAQFTGSTSVIVENVTQSEVLADLSSDTVGVETTLRGNMGDIIRITSMMSGSGSMGPGSPREYESAFSSSFVIPEPAAISILLFGLALTKRRALARGPHRPLMITT